MIPFDQPIDLEGLPTIRQTWMATNWTGRRAILSTFLFPHPTKFANTVMYVFVASMWFTSSQIVMILARLMAATNSRDTLFLGMGAFMVVAYTIRFSFQAYHEGIKAQLRHIQQQALEQIKVAAAAWGDQLAAQLEKSTGHSVTTDPVSLAAAAIELNEQGDSKGNPFKAILSGDLSRAEIDLHDINKRDDPDNPSPDSHY